MRPTPFIGVGRFLFYQEVGMSVQRTKNFIRIDIPGTQGALVTGSVPSKNVTWTTEKNLTIPQARALMDGIVRAVNFVSVKAGVNKPRVGRPGMSVDTDGETFVKRLLFLSDDQYFVTVRRQKLGYGLYSKPVIDMDGLTRDLASAMQCARSLGQAIEDAEKMRR
jgi:hypothetical protein